METSYPENSLKNLQRSMKKGENTMSTVESCKMKTTLLKINNFPLFIWLEQNFRRIQKKPLLQEEVLDKVVKQQQMDENLLAILLFGSLASGTHTWKSDIDLVFVYKKHEPPSGLVNRYVNRIEVQYFFTTLDELVQNVETVPYLLHMFSEAEILLDRNGNVAPVVEQIKEYFAAHPDVEADWVRIKGLHQVEKRGPVCAQTTIIQRWDELEGKYSGGVRKRTFFRSLNLQSQL
jgi:predicted nucleotidyltransferase